MPITRTGSKNLLRMSVENSVVDSHSNKETCEESSNNTVSGASSKDSAKSLENYKDCVTLSKSSKDCAKKSESSKDNAKGTESSKDCVKESESSKDNAKGTESSKDCVKESESSKDNAKGTERSIDCAKESESSKDNAKGTERSKDCAKESESSKDCVKESESSKDNAKGTESAKDFAKESEISKDCVKESESSKDCAKESESSKDCANELESSKDNAKGTESSKDCAKKSESSKDNAKGTESSKDCAKESESSKDNAKGIKSSRDCANGPESLKDDAKGTESSEGCRKESESINQGCHKNHDEKPAEAKQSDVAVIENYAGGSESDQRCYEKRPAEATLINDCIDVSEEETELDLLNMEDFEVVDAFEVEEDPSELCHGSPLPTSGAEKHTRNTQVTHTSTATTDKSNRSREVGDKRSRVHSSKDSSDLRNERKSSESSRRHKRDDSRGSGNSRGRFDTRHDQRKNRSDRPVDKHHSVRSSNHRSNRKRDYCKSKDRNSDSKRVCVREEKNYREKESSQKLRNKQTNSQLSNKQNEINIRNISQNNDQKVSINKRDASDHGREAASASCGSKKVEKNELESKLDCHKVNERSDSILDFLLEKDLAQGDSSIDRELSQVIDDRKQKEENSKQTKSNETLKQALRTNDEMESCQKKCIELNSNTLESKLVRISEGLNKDPQSESTIKDSKLENPSFNQAEEHFKQKCSNIEQTIQTFNLKLLQETAYSNENSNSKQSVEYFKHKDKSVKSAVGLEKEDGKSKRTCDESKQTREESKERSDESKRKSDQSKRRSDQSRWRSDESKHRSDESRQRSGESKRRSDESKRKSDKSKGTSDESKGTSGKPKETSGEPKGTSGEPKGTSGEPKGTSGEPKGTSGEPKGTSGEPKGTSGEPKGTSGEPKGTSGEPKGTSGEPKGTNGKTQQESLDHNQEDAKYKTDVDSEQNCFKIKQKIEANKDDCHSSRNGASDSKQKESRFKSEMATAKIEMSKSELKTHDSEDKDETLMMDSEGSKQEDLLLIKAKETKKSEGVKQDVRISQINDKCCRWDISIESKRSDNRSRNTAKGSRWDKTTKSEQEEKKSQNVGKGSRLDNSKESKQKDGKYHNNSNNTKQEDSKSKQQINSSKPGRDTKSKQEIKDTKKNSPTLQNDPCDMEGMIDKYLESIRKEYATTTKEHVPDNDEVCKKVIGKRHKYRFSKVVIIGDSRIKHLEDVGIKRTFGPLEIKCVPDLTFDNLEEAVKHNVDKSNCPQGILLICSVGIYDVIELNNNLSCKEMLDHEPMEQIYSRNYYKASYISNYVVKMTKRLKGLLGDSSRVYFTSILPVHINKFNECQAKAHEKATGHIPDFPPFIKKHYDNVEKNINKDLNKFNASVIKLSLRGDGKIIPWNILPSNSSRCLEDGINPSRDAVEKYMVPMLKCTIKQYHINRYQEFVIIGDSRLQKVQRLWFNNYEWKISIFTQGKLSFRALTEDNPIVKEISGKKDALIVLSLGMYDIINFVAEDGCDSHKMKLELPSLCFENLDSSDKLWNDFVNSLKSVDELLRKVTTNCDVIITTIYPFDFLTLQNYLVKRHAEETGHIVTIPSQSMEIKEKLNRIGQFILGINRIAFTLAEVKQLPVWDFNSLVFGIHLPKDNVPLIDGFNPTSVVARRIAEACVKFAKTSQYVCSPKLSLDKTEDDADFDKMLHVRQPHLSTLLEIYNFDLSVPPLLIEKKRKGKSDEKNSCNDYYSFIKQKVLVKISSVLRLIPNVYMSRPLPITLLQEMKRESSIDNCVAARGETSTASASESRESTYRTKSRAKYSRPECASPSALSSSPHRHVSEKIKFRTERQHCSIRAGSYNKNRHLDSVSPSSVRLSSPDYQIGKKTKFKWDEADSVIRNKLAGNYTVNYTDSSFTICEDDTLNRFKSSEWLGRNYSPSRSCSPERKYSSGRESSPWKYGSKFRRNSGDMSYSEEESYYYNRKSYSPERISRRERYHSPVKQYPFDRDETFRPNPRRSCSPVQHYAHSSSDRVSSERLRQDRHPSPWKRAMRSSSLSPHWKRSRLRSRSQSGSRSQSRSRSQSWSRSQSRSLSRSRSISSSRSHSSRGRRTKYGSSRGRRDESGSKHSVIVRALHSLREVHDRECDMYRKNPKAHPNYTKEYRTFVDKKRERILSLGGDPSTYDMTREWEIFWQSRMEAIFNECWTVKRDQCVSMLPIDKSYSRSPSPSSSCSVSSDSSSDASNYNCRILRRKRAKHTRSLSAHRKKKIKKIRKNRERSIRSRDPSSHYEDKEVLDEKKRNAKQRDFTRKGRKDDHFQSPKCSSSETSWDNDLAGEKGSSGVANQRLKNVKDTKEKLGMEKMEGIINELLQQVIEPVNPNEHVTATSEKTSSKSEDLQKTWDGRLSLKEGQLNLLAPRNLTEDEVSSTTPSEGFSAEVIKVLELLSHLGERLGALQSSVKLLHEKALKLKSNGLDTMKIFDEIDNKILLHMAADKLRNALQGDKLNLIQKIITSETEQKLSLLLEKEKDRSLLYDLNVDSIANACLGKSSAETTTFIENALMYLGHTEVPQDQLMRIHMAVKTEQAKIFSLSKNVPQGRDCVVSKPLQIPVPSGKPSHHDAVPISQQYTSVPPPSLGSATYSQSHIRNLCLPFPVAPGQEAVPKPVHTISQAPPQPIASTSQTAPHTIASTLQMIPQPVPPPVIMPGSHTFGSSTHTARTVVSDKLSLTDFLSSISSSTVMNSVKPS
ncbi:uncharacterized protein [Procambarus clarkii]|uniref:uncharacterized protein isoform X2 n=1 Tax=Procambarus clarkii TaxID=6728 RepID=UPI0037445051